MNKQKQRNYLDKIKIWGNFITALTSSGIFKDLQEDLTKSLFGLVGSHLASLKFLKLWDHQRNSLAQMNLSI